MDLLKEIKLILPTKDKSFETLFLDFLANLGNRENGKIEFASSNGKFLPVISLNFQGARVPKAVFECKDPVEIELINKTDQDKKSPHVYSPIELSVFINRMANIRINKLDHVGFNIPWFDGVSPDIITLRKELSDKSLYYLFPTGENWDFILPGSEQDIISNKANLTVPRYPKLEIVSFTKSSTPLIQFDISTNEKHDQIAKLFPEGIIDSELKNVWVYIENKFGLDICFVINENHDKDWGEFFEGHRLLPFSESKK